jgi:hypothetical protein
LCSRNSSLARSESCPVITKKSQKLLKISRSVIDRRFFGHCVSVENSRVSVHIEPKSSLSLFCRAFVVLVVGRKALISISRESYIILMVFWISSSYVGRDRKMQKRRQSAQNIAGGAGVDLPQGFVDEKDDGTTRHKLRRRTKPDEKDSRWMVYFVLFFIGVMGAGIFVMRKHDELQRQHLQNDVVEPLNMEWKEKVAELEARNEVLAKQAKDYLTMKEDYERITEELRQAGKLRQGYDNEVDYLKKYKKAIQGKIKRLSKTLLLEK